jgi:hypothetical protein
MHDDKTYVIMWWIAWSRRFSINLENKKMYVPERLISLMWSHFIHLWKMIYLINFIHEQFLIHLTCLNINVYMRSSFIHVVFHYKKKNIALPQTLTPHPTALKCDKLLFVSRIQGSASPKCELVIQLIFPSKTKFYNLINFQCQKLLKT